MSTEKIPSASMIIRDKLNVGENTPSDLSQALLCQVGPSFRESTRKKSKNIRRSLNPKTGKPFVKTY